jgi:DNA mismatch repair protein MutS2
MYAFEHDDILSASVAFDENTLKPLYKLQLGVAGSSHAIAIANRLGLKTSVIDHAKLLLQGRQTNLAKMLEKLSLEQNQLANLKEQTLIEKTQLSKERSQFDA